MVARTDELSPDTDFSFRFALLVIWDRPLAGEYSTAPQFTIAVNWAEGNSNMFQVPACHAAELIMTTVVEKLRVAHRGLRDRSTFALYSPRLPSFPSR